MNKMRFVPYIPFSFLLFQLPLVLAQKVEIQYLANQGVLIKSTDSQILIDAAFQKEFEYLDVLPEAQLTKMENAQAPYDKIDLILATHVHGDHFNGGIVGSHLTRNPKTLFFGPQETVTHFEGNFEGFKDISARVKTETPDLYESKTVILSGIEIKVLRLELLGTSPWKEAENVAYLITLKGKKILHVGDAKLDIKNLEKFNLINENIDVAILPYWQLGPDEQKTIIMDYINPKQILAAHIPPTGQTKAQENIDGLGYENVTILTQQFRTIIVNQ
jgi:L-ascorbate metabolism protein UlaG (beta-lactamase superfamily)